MSEHLRRTLIARVVLGLSVVVSTVTLGVPAAGADSGGGGGGTPPASLSSAPAVTLTPTSLTFGAQEIGTTSAAQSVTVANTGTAPLFINSAATRGADPLDFTEVFDGCSGLSVLSVQVSKVNLPDGTQLWVTLDFGAVGVITLHAGSGTMAPYNMGHFGVSRDQVRVNSALPDIPTAQQILIGGSFT
jgi:hypothetical protein